MKNSAFLFIFTFAFFVTTFTKSGEILAHVDKILFLQGKIGEKSIVVKIKCYDESPVRYLNYYFEDDKTDHYLEGSLMGYAWQFNSIDNQNGEINLVIKEDKNGSWKGFWREGSNKKTELTLNPLLIKPDSKYYSYSQSKELDTYDAYKISILNLDKTKTEKISKHFTLDWYSEKESEISFFRLHSENKKVTTDSINTVLEKLQLAFIQEYFRYNPNRKSLNIQPEILFLNENLISFKIISNTTFKTQNPVNTQQLLCLDLQNGQQIDMESIVWFDEKNPKPEATEIMQTYEYRKAIFAPKVFAILNQLYPEKMQSNNCDLNKLSTWAIPNFAITKQGILFSFNHSPTCDFIDWAIIPFEKLTPYLQKKYKLN